MQSLSWSLSGTPGKKGRESMDGGFLSYPRRAEATASESASTTDKALRERTTGGSGQRRPIWRYMHVCTMDWSTGRGES